ncbi:MAG: hypothetical protein JW795_06455 [Chitinivibrionales bacterium]|nr:hypothetical protein [Chitinivibrionales bacterium]
MFLRKCIFMTSMLVSLLQMTIFGQSRWVWRNQLPQGYSLSALTWTGTQFVAVGEACAILTSKDGISWNVRPDHAYGDLNTVTGNGKILVASGTNENHDFVFILSSADGITWEQSYKNDSLGSIQSMIWTGAQFAGIALTGESMDSSAILTSVDGTHWSLSPQRIKGILNTLLWNGTRLVAVGSTGKGSESDSCIIATSADGVTWTRIGTNVPGELRTVIWNGTRLVAVGASIGAEMAGFSKSSGNIMTSTDGTTWTRQYPDAVYPLNTILWANDRFIAAGGKTTEGKDTGFLVTSSDGIAWTPCNTNSSGKLYTVIWNGSQYIVYGSNGTILSSSDGTTWTSQVSQWSPEANPVQSNGTIRVSVGALGRIATSTDGIAWKEQSSGTGVTRPLKSVFWTGSQLVAVGASGQTKEPMHGNCILTSPDGITWTSRTVPVNKELFFVTGSNSQLLAVGDTGTILTSPDGVTWTARSSGTTVQLYGAAWNGTVWVIVGEGGITATSTDGIEWKWQTSPEITGSLLSIVWTGKHLLAGGIPGIFSSTNGTDWTMRFQDLAVFSLTRTSDRTIARVNFGLLTAVSTDDTTWSGTTPIGVALGAMTAVGTTAIARSNGSRTGAFYTSSDGTNWKPVAAGLYRSINSLTWTGKLLVGVGQYGAILTAPADSGISKIGFINKTSKKDLLQTISMHTSGLQLSLRFFPRASNTPFTVSLYNLSGKKITQWRGCPVVECMVIPLPAVAAGVYHASIEYDGRTFVRSVTFIR